MIKTEPSLRICYKQPALCYGRNFLLTNWYTLITAIDINRTCDQPYGQTVQPVLDGLLDKEGHTPLFLARTAEIVPFQIAQGESLAVQDESGRTALFQQASDIAVRGGERTIVTLLSEAMTR